MWMLSGELLLSLKKINKKPNSRDELAFIYLLGFFPLPFAMGFCRLCLGDGHRIRIDDVDRCGLGVLDQGADEFPSGAEQGAFLEALEPSPEVDAGCSDETNVVANVDQRAIGQEHFHAGFRLLTGVGRTEQGRDLDALHTNIELGAGQSLEDVHEPLSGSDDDILDSLGRQFAC